MAQIFFLKIADIDGECAVEGHAKEIQVLSWSHSFNQPTSPTRSGPGGGTVEQANHADFSFTKYTDIASVPMLKQCWNGKTIRAATFTACRSDGDASVEYLKVEMSDVIISNISLGGGTGDAPIETVTLSYRAVKYSYTLQPAGSPASARPSARHDLALMKVE
jgi:type VI secretion system secreted protein Hcp